MRLISMSRNGFINHNGLNFSCIVEDTDGDIAYEHTLVPFIGFNDFDFSGDGKSTMLTSHFNPVVSGSTLYFSKSKVQKDDGLVMFAYSFPIIEGGQFGTYQDSLPPEHIYKFVSGNFESGYFYELLLILKKNTLYEIIYHSEYLSKITKTEIFWDDESNFISVKPSSVM